MSRPLIILGAGASNGCLTEEQKKYRKKSLDFPLVDQIFSPQYFSYLKENIKPENLKRFIDPLFSKEIRDVLIGGDYYLKQISARLMNRESLEKEVSAFWKIATKENNETMRKQLIAFSFYLQFLFYFLSEDAEKEDIPGNSYNALVGEITDLLFRDKNAEAFVINFNYDLLMKNALKKFDDKIKNKLSYKPIHGSCDNCWISHPDQRRDMPRAPWESLHSQRDRIENFDFYEFFEPGPKEYNFLEACRIIQNGSPHVPRPVLTLPFFEKQEYNNRYQEIVEWFKYIDRILIIGWSVKDNDFIELMNKNIRDELIPLSVVAGNKDDIDNIFAKFPEKKFSRAAEYVGFYEFMNSQGCKTFFGTA